MRKMTKWNGPIPVRDYELLRKKGIYRVKVAENKFDPQIHFDRIILIGKTDSSLFKRIGDFLAAASGENVSHAEGIRFYEKRNEHKLEISDLEIEYKICECPTCEEIKEFIEFSRRTKKFARPYLCKITPRSCSKHPGRI